MTGRSPAIDVLKWFVGCAVLLALFVASPAAAEAPPITDPDMQAPEGAMPGTFPESVTAANVNAAPIPGSEIGGAGSDNIKVQFPAAGPIKWTESRHNEGDIAILIGPFDPDDASYFPPDDFVDNYQPLEADPFANTTLAWRVNRERGALLATTRHNGVDNGDTLGGNPVGTIHGIAYFNSDFGQGWGYRMNDGVFANGGGASADLQMGVAGFDDGNSEAVFNTATAFFPYEQGWPGAWVDAADDGEATFSTGNPSLDPSVVTWTDSVATVSLPDVDSATDGMLFVAPTSGNNSTDIAAAFPVGNGWNVTVREDEDSDTTGMTINVASDNGFQFLYVPYDANGLIGGHVDGSDGSVINGAGQASFALSRNGSGEYAVSVLDSDGETKLTENDGMLILSVAGALPESTTLADRKFLSYEYDDGSGDFIIQSREVAGTNSPNSENIFGDDLALSDVDFYFAFVDFEVPFGFGKLGDFTGDRASNFGDLSPAVLALTNPDQFALDFPDVNLLDACDANRDGACNFGDLSGITAAILAPGSASSQAVPEPGTIALVSLMAICAGLFRGRPNTDRT